ncbi:MAG TPA: hypothetical protein VK789_28165 [Bryobacteraceae bacterium]|jgi:hypothetical protein|nr:hypothetical protein [Bryobacteraceae bacterium]
MTDQEFKEFVSDCVERPEFEEAWALMSRSPGIARVETLTWAFDHIKMSRWHTDRLDLDVNDIIVEATKWAANPAAKSDFTSFLMIRLLTLASVFFNIGAIVGITSMTDEEEDETV